MKKQIELFIKYFLSIQDGTNKDLSGNKIDSLVFNTEFYQALIKAQYIKKDDKTFRGYEFTIDIDENADYWGMNLSPIIN